MITDDLLAAATHASAGALKAALLYAVPTVVLLRRRPAARTAAYMALFVGVARFVSRLLARRRRREPAAANESAVRFSPNALAGAIAAALALLLLEPSASVQQPIFHIYTCIQMVL